MNRFAPNYKNVVYTAFNKEAPRIPVYEHIVSCKKIGEIIGVEMEYLSVRKI